MTALTLDIDLYLTEADKKEIAIEEFTKAARQHAIDDLERIVSNGAYKLVFEAVNQALGQDSEELIRDKAVDIINSLTAGSVFRTADAWHRGESKAQRYLMEAVEDNKSLLEERVKSIMSQYSEEKLYSILDERLPLSNYEKMKEYWDEINHPHIPQHVVCAAVRFGDIILAGVRHWDSIMHTQCSAMGGKHKLWSKVGREEQGFIDQFGTFLTREEAYIIVQENGQPFSAERNGSNYLLFSEGLY